MCFPACLAHRLQHSKSEKVKIAKQNQMKGENIMLPILRNHGLRFVRPGETFGSLTRLLDEFLPDVQPWRHTGNLDVYEDDKNLYVEAELAGFHKDQIELILEDGVLHLKAEQQEEKEDRQET